MSNKLTEKSYWDATYPEGKVVEPIATRGYRNRCKKKIYEKKEPYLREALDTLEIGGGGSAWLLYLAETYPDTQFVALDYSDSGCTLLREAIEKRCNTNVAVWTEDFFNPRQGFSEFDFVYSHGVVEHFHKLSEVLNAHAAFLAENGKMLTIIPNMAGVLGLLTKWMNRSVYDIHVPHDLKSLENGHSEAGLAIVDSGYLCSNNFGVLSSCVRQRIGLKWKIYQLLGRLSKTIWFLEDRLFGLPTSKLFSPYIYVVSERED